MTLTRHLLPHLVPPRPDIVIMRHCQDQLGKLSGPPEPGELPAWEVVRFLVQADLSGSGFIDFEISHCGIQEIVRVMAPANLLSGTFQVLGLPGDSFFWGGRAVLASSCVLANLASPKFWLYKNGQ